MRSCHSYEADHRLCQQSIDRIIAHASQNTDKGYECMYVGPTRSHTCRAFQALLRVLPQVSHTPHANVALSTVDLFEKFRAPRRMKVYG